MIRLTIRFACAIDMSRHVNKGSAPRWLMDLIKLQPRVFNFQACTKNIQPVTEFSSQFTTVMIS
jgi:hypothetical protein